MQQTLEQALADVARIEDALAKAEMRLLELENARGSIALEGGDVDAHHVELIRINETIKTMRAALDLARQREIAARAAARRAALEERARKFQVDALPLITAARTDATLALRTAVALIEDMAAAKAEIDAFNGGLGPDDGDLAVPVGHGALEPPLLPFKPPGQVREPNEDEAAFAARQKAADAAWTAGVARAERPYEPLEDEQTFHARQAEAMRHVKRRNNESDSSIAQRRAIAKAEVLRRGETEEEYRRRLMGAKLGVFQQDGERAQAFGLRVSNAQSQHHRRTASTDDALRQAGELAMDAIMRHALGMGAFERERKFPAAFKPHAVVGADGRPAMKPHLWPETARHRLRPVKLQ